LPLPALPLPGLPLPIPAPLAGHSYFMDDRALTPEYLRWLDEGSGGMGDLVVIKN
jgi:hypothetical protein